jgi:hypothetical protein
MSIKVFAKALNADSLFGIQRVQYAEKIVLEDTVAANSSKIGKVSISNVGHFLCMYFTGKFTTNNTGGAGAGIDTGVNYLKGLLFDGAGQRKLFNDYIPLDLIFSPGRVRNGTATNCYQPDGAIITASGSNSLYMPMEFEYLFQSNSDILFDVKNSSGLAIDYSICFHGIRIKTTAGGR